MRKCVFSPSGAHVSFFPLLRQNLCAMLGDLQFSGLPAREFFGDFPGNPVQPLRFPGNNQQCGACPGNAQAIRACIQSDFPGRFRAGDQRKAIGLMQSIIQRKAQQRAIPGFQRPLGRPDIEPPAKAEPVERTYGQLAALAGVIPTYYSIIASAERIIEIETYDDELDADEDIGDRYEYYEKLKSIEFDSITFKYNRDYVFEDASATINKGDFAAITGISGIGKSTLLKLLLGVMSPEKGTIRVVTDDSERTVDRNTRKLFSYVPQGNMLLSGTLRENITFMCDEKSDEEIKRAVQLSCSDEFVSQLPEGTETVVGERGLGLSEGQIQRIAIARAILYDAPILLLDEATSALDEATEERLLKNLRGLENRTCIIITHKPAALNVCNKEVRIEDRKICITETPGGKSDEN